MTEVICKGCRACGNAVAQNVQEAPSSAMLGQDSSGFRALGHRLYRPCLSFERAWRFAAPESRNLPGVSHKGLPRDAPLRGGEWPNAFEFLKNEHLARFRSAPAHVGYHTFPDILQAEQQHVMRALWGPSSAAPSMSRFYTLDQPWKREARRGAMKQFMTLLPGQQLLVAIPSSKCVNAQYSRLRHAG